MYLKLRLIIVIIFLPGCSSVKQYPPKSWWHNPQSMKEVEMENDQYIADNKSVLFEENYCVEYEEGNGYLVRGELIFWKNCIKLSDLDEGMIDKRYEEFLKEHRLIYAPEWQELKVRFVEGDEVRGYAAPPMSGGFGIILVRDGIVIYVYEQGTQ